MSPSPPCEPPPCDPPPRMPPRMLPRSIPPGPAGVPAASPPTPPPAGAPVTMALREPSAQRTSIGSPMATEAARDAGVPLRSVQRWLVRYRATGVAGLVRVPRSDTGHRKLPAALVEVIGDRSAVHALEPTPWREGAMPSQGKAPNPSSQARLVIVAWTSAGDNGHLTEEPRAWKRCAMVRTE